MKNIIFTNLELTRKFLLFQIVPGGIAQSSGKLRMGDRILKVNDEDVTKVPHQEAVMALLKPTKNNEIVLTVQHDPLPDGFQVSNCCPLDGSG